MSLMAPLPTSVPSWNVESRVPPQETRWTPSSQGSPEMPSPSLSAVSCSSTWDRSFKSSSVSSALPGTPRKQRAPSSVCLNDTRSMERTDAAQIRARGRRRGMPHGCTLSPATLGPGGHLSLVSYSVFGNRKPKRKSPHPLTLSCTPPHILAVVQSFLNDERKNPSIWLQWGLG